MDSSEPALVGAVRDLRVSVDKLRDELVRKDVYEAERAADRAEVQSLREDVSDIKGTMRWLSRTIVASLLIPIASSAVIIYVLQQGAR